MRTTQTQWKFHLRAQESPVPTLALQQSLYIPKPELEPWENKDRDGEGRLEKQTECAEQLGAHEQGGGKKNPEQTGGSQELSLLSLTFADAVSGSDFSQANCWSAPGIAGDEGKAGD